MKTSWALPTLAFGSIFLAACFQSDPVSEPVKNELTYGALSGLNWTRLGRPAADIGVGAGSVIWRVDSNSVNGEGNLAYRDLSVSGGTWTNANARASRIEVDDQGLPWRIRSTGEAYRGSATGSPWIQYNLTSTGASIKVRDIGVRGICVWAIAGETADANGYGVYRLDNGKWVVDTRIKATRITVDSYGRPWVATKSGLVYLLTGGAWQQKGSGVAAIAIGAGPDGQVWINEATVAPEIYGGKIWKWTASGWDLCDNGVSIEIDRGNGYVIAINKASDIWMGVP